MTIHEFQALDGDREDVQECLADALTDARATGASEAVVILWGPRGGQVIGSGMAGPALIGLLHMTAQRLGNVLLEDEE